MARRGRAGRVAGVLTALLVLGAGGYATADAYDLVPGLVTLDPVPPPPPPFPTAPAAVDPPPVDVTLPDPAAAGPVELNPSGTVARLSIAGAGDAALVVPAADRRPACSPPPLATQPEDADG